MVEENSAAPLSEERRRQLEEEAGVNWDKFYGIHANRFFKDRNWLFTELPELESLHEGRRTVLEVGCGVGNTVFPILQAVPNPELRVFCCDFSSKAVALLQQHEDFDAQRCSPFVCDVTDIASWSSSAPPDLTADSLDVALLVFALSAMEPAKMAVAARAVAQRLRPGGILFFRDYGRYDLAQLRFKSNRCIGRDFYARGDGTRCFFFTSNFVQDLFVQQAGLEELENKVDTRLQVNRGKNLKMYRVWLQAKYRKPCPS